MDLEKLRKLTTADKLISLRTTAGLQQLEEWLKEGKSLSKIARIVGICAETLYRWSVKYPDIAEVIKPYAPIMATPIADMSRPVAYRIICAYEDIKTSILGSIYDEYETPEELWNSQFMKEYFGLWKIDASDYYDEYKKSLSSRGVYRLSHYICIAHCKVTARGKIKPLASPTI